MPVQLVAEDGLAITVRPEIIPGNAVIGSGMMAASNWLNYRKQNVHCGLARSLLHLTEAKQFAETDQLVGTFRETVLLYAGDSKPLNWTDTAQRMLQDWWNKYGLPSSGGFKDELYDDAVREVFGLPKP